MARSRRITTDNLILQGDWSGGFVRDAPRVGLRPGTLYDAADYILNQPGLAYKRGGSAYAGPVLTAATYATAVAYAAFPAGSQLIAVGDNGHLYKVTSVTTTDLATMGAAYTPIDNIKLRVGATSHLIITAKDGTSAPFGYDGTTAALLAGSPPAGRYAAVYKTRLVLASTVANPSRIFFSPTPAITTTWDATSFIDADFQVKALASLKNVLLVFGSGATSFIAGSTPPPGTDMSMGPVGSIGCSDARSIAIWLDNVIFANQEGVFLTNGAGFRSLTQPPEFAGVGIGSYWRDTLLSGYDPATWTISGGVSGDLYFVSVMNGATIQGTLICDLQRRAWTRLTNIKSCMFAPSSGIARELYYADRAAARVTKLSGLFSPAAANKLDADGTAVQPLLETGAIGTGPGMKAFGFGRVSLDMRDAAADNPSMAVSVASGVEAATFVAVPESPLAKTTDSVRSRFKIAADSQAVSIRFQQTGASAKTEIRALEVDERPYPTSAEGQ